MPLGAVRLVPPAEGGTHAGFAGWPSLLRRWHTAHWHAVESSGSPSSKTAASMGSSGSTILSRRRRADADRFVLGFV